MTYGLKSFQVQGSKILNELKDLDYYNHSRTKKQFLKQFKVKFLATY